MNEPCVSGCGCDDFMACYCADCAVSPTFDREGMARFHEELVNVGITGRSPEEEARIFDAVRLVSARHAAIPAPTPASDHVRTTGAVSRADASVGRTDGSIGIPVLLGTPGSGARHGEKSPA